MRLATWNVNSVQARLPRLLDWLEDDRARTCSACRRPRPPTPPSRSRRSASSATRSRRHGDGRWNGVAILSRVGLDDVTRGFPGEPGFPDPEARADLAPPAAGCGSGRCTCPTAGTLDDPHYAYKLAWLAALRDALAAELGRPARPLAVCGDFNVAPTDDDVWDPAAFIGSTHVTPAGAGRPGRAARPRASRRRARAAEGPQPFTYWDYRAGMFHKDMGMRIDLVLASAPVAAAVTDAYIDREARKGKGPSDHAPIVVDLDLPAAG